MTLQSLLVRLTLGTVLLAGLFVGGYQLLALPYFDIRYLDIRGEVDGMAVRDVRNRVEDSLQGNILTADILAVRDAVQSLSWVRSATVTRVFPDTVNVSIQRHKSVAIWEDGRLVSSEGRLFTSNDESIERLAQLPMFSGDSKFAVDAVKYLPSFQQSADRIGARIKSVSVSFRGSWNVTIEKQGGVLVAVELGRALTESGPLDRFNRAVDNFYRVADMMEGYPSRIDVRYRDSLAVQLPNHKANQLWLTQRGSNATHKGGS